MGLDEAVSSQPGLHFPPRNRARGSRSCSLTAQAGGTANPQASRLEGPQAGLVPLPVRWPLWHTRVAGWCEHSHLADKSTTAPDASQALVAHQVTSEPPRPGGARLALLAASQGPLAPWSHVLEWRERVPGCTPLLSHPTPSRSDPWPAHTPRPRSECSWTQPSGHFLLCPCPHTGLRGLPSGCPSLAARNPRQDCLLPGEEGRTAAHAHGNF